MYRNGIVLNRQLVLDHKWGITTETYGGPEGPFQTQHFEHTSKFPLPNSHFQIHISKFELRSSSHNIRLLWEEEAQKHVPGREAG